MPKKSIQFISGFLIPSLNKEKFGERLKWISKSERKFQILWHHKGGPGWTEQEAEVFVEWDKQKGHFQPNDSGYFTQSKQRFRSLLYKLTKEGQLIKEKYGNDKYKRTYSLGKKKQRRCRNSSKSDAEVEISAEEDDDSEKIDEIYSEEDNVNVLEDHTYSTSSNSPQNISADYRYEEMDYSNIEKRVLKERNILEDDHAGVILNNINLSEMSVDFSPDQNVNITKISENDHDFTSGDQYRNSEDKSLMECLEFLPTQLPVTNHAFEWTVNNVLYFLYN